MSQKITYAHIQNFKGIKDIEVKDLSRFVAIFGSNGAGKTSFLEAIKNAIKLEKGGNGKVTVGKEKGLIEVHFDDFKIKRIIGTNGKLEVEHNGELVGRPQERLDSIFLGTIGDPQKFLNLRNKEKVKYILETHGKKLMFDELEEKRVKKFDLRQDIHRKVLSKEEEVKQFDTSEFEGMEQDSIIDIDSLQAQLSEMEEHNRGIYNLESRKEKGETTLQGLTEMSDKIDETIKETDVEIERLQQRIKDKQKEKENLIKRKTENKAELTKANDLLKEIEASIEGFDKKDTGEIKEKISSYGEYQQSIASIKAKKEIYEENKTKASELRIERKKLNDEVLEIEKEQNELIEGIELSYKIKVEEGIMFVYVDKQWIPLDDLNTAYQLDLGIDICLNGPNKIKIITIENANALDPKTMEKIKKKIEDKQGQCFLETVYPTGYESITITDGEVLSDGTNK